MGNCCGGEDKEEIPNQSIVNTGPSYGTDPSQYKTASRDEVVAAAERRLAQQKAKNEIKTLRNTSADLPEAPNSGGGQGGGLRWQVG